MNKDDYEVIDNFLEKQDFESIKNLIMGPYFPWYYRDGVVKKENDKKDQFQFSHLFYTDNLPTSPLFNELSPILLKINAISLLRVNANLNQRTAVFYLNTNNGYTLFEDGTKIESVENRFVSFKTSILHTGSTCTNSNRRVLINFNYIA